MPKIKRKPEGPYCYKNSVFVDSETCPDYDESITMKPKCLKYDYLLRWSVSGKTLKCETCLKEERETSHL